MAPRFASRNKSGHDYARHFRDVRLLHDLTVLPEERSWHLLPPPAMERHQVVLYLGCNVLLTSHMVRTVTAIFDLLGIDYVAVGGPAYCCGIVHDRFGDTQLSQAMGRNAVRSLERFHPERVVMWCPSCIHYYDEVFRVPASFQTQHVTEFLVEQLGRLRFLREVPLRVALHHHCNRPRRLMEAKAAETLLSAVPGLEYVHIESDPRLDRICSEFNQQTLGLDTWEQIIERQFRDAGERGATTFATLYHGCQRLLCPYEERYPLVIEHYLSIFARALGIEYEDSFKKYRLWRDPERVLVEMAPCMQASRVEEDEARRVVLRNFPAAK